MILHGCHDQGKALAEIGCRIMNRPVGFSATAAANAARAGSSEPQIASVS
jgi:hypothetical protein